MLGVGSNSKEKKFLCCSILLSSLISILHDSMPTGSEKKEYNSFI